MKVSHRMQRVILIFIADNVPLYTLAEMFKNLPATRATRARSTISLCILKVSTPLSTMTDRVVWILHRTRRRFYSENQ